MQVLVLMFIPVCITPMCIRRLTKRSERFFCLWQFRAEFERSAACQQSILRKKHTPLVLNDRLLNI